ncbi:MAG: cupin domain-containing protein [Terriglobales bacterium]
MSVTRRDFSRAAVLAGMFGGGFARMLAQAAPAAAQALFTNFEDIQWQPLLPDYGPGGPRVVILHTDPKTQATQLMIRMPGDFYVPRHWHSANETHFLLQGSVIFECDGRRAEQGPGSFNYIPAKMMHQAWSKSGPEAITFITVDAAWDIHWVDGPPKPGKVTE